MCIELTMVIQRIRDGWRPIVGSYLQEYITSRFWSRLKPWVSYVGCIQAGHSIRRVVRCRMSRESLRRGSYQSKRFTIDLMYLFYNDPLIDLAWITLSLMCSKHSRRWTRHDLRLIQRKHAIGWPFNSKELTVHHPSVLKQIWLRRERRRLRREGREFRQSQIGILLIS